MAEATSVMPVRDEQFRIRGLRIHAQIRGEGEPLLLYSGIWGQLGLWERLLPHLPGFQTIAFDPPGIGRSQTPRFPQTMWALADFGNGVLDELGLESAHVLGASFGGAVAQQMAFSHPRRVRRLVLATTSFGGFAMPGNLQALWHFIHPNAYHPERLERVAGAMFGGRLRTEPELVRTMHIKRPTDTLAALYRMSALFGWTSMPWLWAIRQPTLVIAGDDDPITPLINHRVIAMLMPRATLRVIKGGGHLVLLDSAEQVGPVITSFLRGDGDLPVPGDGVRGTLRYSGLRGRFPGMNARTEPVTYALLADGTTVEIRPTRPDDFEAVRDMHAGMSTENLYMRFFGISRVAAEQEARRVCREPAPDRAALLAILDGRVIGCISYQLTGEESAEIAMAVADDMHSRGVGTLLLEHMISLARGQGVRTFVAETLAENAPMLNVFAHAGLRPHRTLADGVYEFSFPLPGGEGDARSGAYRDAVAERERSADVASLRHVLTPASVAVIGVSRRPGSVGRAILDNIVDAGFSGRVYAVNPRAGELQADEAGGVPWVPSAAALPEPVDLAVIAAPAAAVAAIADDCGRRGVKALVVTASGLDAPARAGLLATCRRHGMRLIGPNSFGVASAASSLNATFSAHRPGPGRVGLALQSGGVGIVLLEHLSRLGIGISSFVSLGDKDDVSGNDMLLWWQSDAATKLALLYLDSFGNPRKFARTARALGRAIPVLTVNAGRSPAGRRMAAVRAAAEQAPHLTRQALFEQAGVLATANLGELLDTTVLLASQPVPAGRRVGVVSNTRGGAVLAADACGDAGLQIASLAEDTQRALRTLLPDVASVAGPVNTTAAVAPGVFRRCLELVGADPGVDAVLVLTATTATSDLVPEVRAPRLPVPVAVAVMDQVEAVRLLPGQEQGSPAVPAYAYPESAARALGHAAHYGEWRAAPPGSIPELEGVDRDRATELADDFLAENATGGWLPPEQAAELLSCYGVRLADAMTAGTADGAAMAPARSGGVEVKINVLEEQVFGPLVLLELADAAADTLAGRAARLAPMTESDADEMIRSVPVLLGHRGAPAADIAALKDMLLRVSQLAEDLPQVAELELSPVVASPDGVVAMTGQVRIQAAAPADSYLRRLR